MKTTIDIPDEALQELMKHTKSKVKRDAVVTAIAEYNLRKRREVLAKTLGTFEKIISQKDLQRMRSVE